MNDQPQRKIRSFVRREGRYTHAQRRAFDALWARYGVTLGDRPLDLDILYGRHAPRVLEIGFGTGDALLDMAAAHPDTDYLGIEVYRPGVGKLFQRIEEQGLNNIRVICADAMEVLVHHIPDHGLDTVLLFFPDPWPKTRHHKRRIVQPEFVALIRRKLKQGGVFHMATDWKDYARYMLEVMSAAPGFVNTAGPGRYAPRPACRPLTKFEQRGAGLGHPIFDLIFLNGDGLHVRL